MIILTKHPDSYAGKLAPTQITPHQMVNCKVDYIIKKYPQYNVTSFRDLYRTKRGRTAWLIAYGPSWDKLVGHEPKDDTFVINRAIVGYPNATYWAAHDCAVIPECLASKSKDTTIITFAANVFSEVEWPRNGSVVIEADPNPERWLLPEKRPLYYNQTTFGWLLHLIVMMGYDRVNLLGTDDHTTTEYKHPVFDEKELRRQHVGVRERILEMFSPAVQPSWRVRDIKIVDYSEGSLSDLPGIIHGNLQAYLGIEASKQEDEDGTRS